MLFPFAQLQGNYLYFEIMDLQGKMISVTKKVKGTQGNANDLFYFHRK